MFRFLTRNQRKTNDSQRRADLQASVTSWLYASEAAREIREEIAAA